MWVVVGRCPAECHGGAPTRVRGCRTGICMMVEGRTGGGWTRGSRAHGSGVIQSGGTGRAGRGGSCRAGAGHAYHVRVGRTEARREANWRRGAGGSRESWPGGCGWAGAGPASRVGSICGAGWDARCGGSGRAAAGRAGRVESVGGTERVRDDGRMPGGRVWQVAVGRRHVGRTMRVLGVPGGSRCERTGYPTGNGIGRVAVCSSCGGGQHIRGRVIRDPCAGVEAICPRGGGSLQRI